MICTIIPGIILAAVIAILSEALDVSINNVLVEVKSHAAMKLFSSN